MPKLLVTGASGYLGSVVAARAAGDGWDVVGTYLTHPPQPCDGVRPEPVDLRDGEGLARLIALEAPDAIVHTAYRQDGPDADAINVEGSAGVAVAARRCGARLVHLSTDMVFGGAPGRPLHEHDPVAPITAYGLAKAQAEAAVRAAHATALIVRTSLIYGGPRGPQSKYEQLALEAAAGRRDDVAFFTNEIRCPVQVGDLAAALLELVTTARAGVLHVAGPDAVDRYAFACLIAGAAGADPARLRGAEGPPDRPADLRLDTTRARAILHGPPRGVHAVLG